MLETPKALDTIIKYEPNRPYHSFAVILLSVKILMDITMDNQQETNDPKRV
jgi:hypothetical protein